MDFRSLRYFVTVAREQNITRAAAVLKISQPPLSANIHNLEEELGTELFQRTRKGVVLTPTGTILYDRARQILEMAQRTREEISAADNGLSGSLSIGTVEGRAPSLAAEWIQGFHEEFPMVTYTLRCGGTDELLEQLYRHTLDLAVIAAPYNSELLYGVSVDVQPWVALIPAGHPLARRKGTSIRLAELEDQELILPDRLSRLNAMEKWFSENNVHPKIVFQTSSYSNAAALVSQGAGISIFPMTAGMMGQNMVRKVIKDPSRWVEYVLVCQKEIPLSEVSRAFWDYVMDNLEEQKMDLDLKSREDICPHEEIDYL